MPDRMFDLMVYFRSGGGMKVCLPEKVAREAVQKWTDGVAIVSGDGWAFVRAEAMGVCICPCRGKRGLLARIFSRT